MAHIGACKLSQDLAMKDFGVVFPLCLPPAKTLWEAASVRVLAWLDVCPGRKKWCFILQQFCLPVYVAHIHVCPCVLEPRYEVADRGFFFIQRPV